MQPVETMSGVRYERRPFVAHLVGGLLVDDDGYVHLPGGRKAKALTDAPRTWWDAHSACKNINGRLIMIQDVETSHAVEMYATCHAPDKGKSKNAWSA